MKTVGRGKYTVTSYVPKDIYDFLQNHKGDGALSSYLCGLLTAYAEIVQDDDQKELEIAKENEKILA